MTHTPTIRRRPLLFRRLGDSLLSVFSLASIIVAVGSMAWILATVLIHGSAAIGADILFSPSKPYGEPGGGIANALLGSLFITLGAALLAVPPAMAAGIYLAEYGKGRRVADILRFCANVLMGLPSILVGLFVYVLIVMPAGHFSGLAGTVALAIIMFPVVMRTTEDMMAMVPDTMRESALALGMTRMRTILCIIARSAKNGLATGVLLSLARVSGETAPLLFTAMFADTWPTGFFREPVANIPVLITEYTTNSPFESMHALGWAAALVIAACVLLVNILTRIIFHEQKH